MTRRYPPIVSSRTIKEASVRLFRTLAPLTPPSTRTGAHVRRKERNKELNALIVKTQ